VTASPADPAPPRPEPRARRPRAFDRPVTRDPLLWSGVALGVALVVMSPPGDVSWAGALLDVVYSLVAGMGIAAFFGGFARNLLRALSDDDDPDPEEPR
jgi:hypothetical protein